MWRNRIIPAYAYPTAYCRNANTAFFDGLSLYREKFGQSYTYDEDNNLISAVDAQKNATKFEYNAKQRPDGNHRSQREQVQI